MLKIYISLGPLWELGLRTSWTEVWMHCSNFCSTQLLRKKPKIWDFSWKFCRLFFGVCESQRSSIWVSRNVCPKERIFDWGYCYSCLIHFLQRGSWAQLCPSHSLCSPGPGHSPMPAVCNIKGIYTSLLGKGNVSSVADVATHTKL